MIIMRRESSPSEPKSRSRSKSVTAASSKSLSTGLMTFLRMDRVAGLEDSAAEESSSIAVGSTSIGAAAVSVRIITDSELSEEDAKERSSVDIVGTEAETEAGVEAKEAETEAEADGGEDGFGGETKTDGAAFEVKKDLLAGRVFFRFWVLVF